MTNKLENLADQLKTDRNKCPNCGAENIGRTPPEASENGMTIFRSAQCSKCDSGWVETFTLSAADIEFGFE